jgi:hypothetical protein
MYAWAYHIPPNNRVLVMPNKVHEMDREEQIEAKGAI